MKSRRKRRGNIYDFMEELRHWARYAICSDDHDMVIGLVGENKEFLLVKIWLKYGGSLEPYCVLQHRFSVLAIEQSINAQHLIDKFVEKIHEKWQKYSRVFAKNRECLN